MIVVPCVGEPSRMGAPQVLFAFLRATYGDDPNRVEYDVGSDGRFIAVRAGQDTSGGQLRVVVNWASTCRRRRPTKQAKVVRHGLTGLDPIWWAVYVCRLYGLPLLATGTLPPPAGTKCPLAGIPRSGPLTKSFAFIDVRATAPAGTALGKSPVTHSHRGRSMQAAEGQRVEESSVLRRQRDRRRGLGDVLATLARAVSGRADAGQLRGAFEESLKRALPVRSIVLRDRASRWPADKPDAGVEALAFEVVGPSAAQRGMLEATFDRSRRLGDWDFQLMGHAAQLGALVLEVERARAAAGRGSTPVASKPRRDGAAPLIGSTPAMASLRDRIERVAATDFTVLLEGESGVGKELVARQIHELSPRRQGPFVAINCAALVETLLEAELFGIEERTATGVRGRRGKFEHADGGTLFLDEVSDLSLSAQAKLLRAIQDLAVERVGGTGTQRVDIRIVAATNRSLAEMVERKLFRADLFYRLGGVDLRVPSLRERRPDVIELAAYFLERHRHVRVLTLSEPARDALLLYDWPGNVRELERMIERAVALADTHVIELDDLPPIVRGDFDTVLLPSLKRGETMRAWGSRYARIVLDRSGGNKREASRVLGISYHTLNSYLRFPLAVPGEVESEDAELLDAGVVPADQAAEPA